VIINHNCCIKLVPLVIFIYDARTHIYKIYVLVNIPTFISLKIHDELKLSIKNMRVE